MFREDAAMCIELGPFCVLMIHVDFLALRVEVHVFCFPASYLDRSSQLQGPSLHSRLFICHTITTSSRPRRLTPLT
jgi:hypothetical protein